MSDFEEFVSNMNRKARRGEYDQVIDMKDLEKRVKDGDLRAKSRLEMHRRLELSQQLHKDGD